MYETSWLAKGFTANRRKLYIRYAHDFGQAGYKPPKQRYREQIYLPAKHKAPAERPKKGKPSEPHDLPTMHEAQPQAISRQS